MTTPNPQASWPDRIALGLLVIGCALLLVPRPARVAASTPLQLVLLAPLRLKAAVSEHLSSLAAENRRLERLAAELAVDNARLLALAGARENAPASPLPLLRCRVIARDMATFRRYLLVSQGENDGILTGQPALTAAGVVGRTIVAGPHQTLVQTLYAPDCRVTVQSKRTRVPGLARADESGLLLVDYVPKEADFAVNDTVVTAGLGGVFPKGLGVGTVVSVPDRPGSMFRTVLVRPFVDVATLQDLFVLRLPDATARQDDWLDNTRPPEVTIPEENP